MAPTPIKIKGKGPRKKGWAPPDPSRFKEIKRQRQEEHAARKRRKRQTPLIEQLPTEILEQIFLLSENLNFPRSSHRIGLSLSAPGLFLELTVGAFTPTWIIWLGCRRHNVNSYYGHLDDHERFGGNPDFQSDVLACRWMNLTLLENAQQVFCRRHKIPAPRSPEYVMAETDQSTTGLGSFSSELLDQDLKALQIHCQNDDFYGEFGGRKAIQAVFGLYGVGSYMEMHPLTRIPDHLLAGPFDNWEKIRLLFWMIRSGGHIFPPSSPHHQPYELTKGGYAQIVKMEDPTVANLLLRLFFWIGAFDDWPLSLKEKKLKAAERRLDHLNRGIIEEIFAEAL
ncbi:hypothetical protein V8F20_000738 [Naviculisporaceae sp. PSN 640]